MAAIVESSIAGVGDKPITEVTLTASNTMTYKPGAGQILRLRNATAGALTPLITGSGAVSTVVPRVGTVNFAAGYTVPSMAVGAVRDIFLDSIPDYLVGTLNIANATGIVATLIVR